MFCLSPEAHPKMTVQGKPFVWEERGETQGKEYIAHNRFPGGNREETQEFLYARKELNWMCPTPHSQEDATGETWQGPPTGAELSPAGASEKW